MTADDEAGDSGAFGAPDDRSQVPGIGHPVESQQERRTATSRRGEVGQVSGLDGLRTRDHALRGFGSPDRVELARVDLSHRDVQFVTQLDDVVIA